MYRQIRISGFRGADDVTLDKLGRLNILVGRNNTGKSSCLEAISLMGSGRHLFRNTFGESTLEQILGRRVETDEGWKHLTHDGRENAVVKGVPDSGAAETLEIAGSPYDMESIPGTGQIGEIRSRIKSKVGLESVRHAFYFYFHSDARVLGALYAAGSAVRHETAPPGLGSAAGPSLFIKNPDLVPKELYKRTVSSGKIHDVIDRLRAKVPDADDIRQIDGEMYMFLKDRVKRPLSLMGDGFRAAVLLSMSGHLLQGGTMAVEEPENHTHPALMFHIVDELLKSCRDYGNQVFIATHSDELVERALETAPSNEDVSVFKMNKLHDKTYVESFDRDEAREYGIDLELDMRGM